MKIFEITEKEADTLISLLKLNGECEYRFGTSGIYKYKDPLQISMLKKVYSMTSYPSTDTRNSISVLLKIPQRSIQVWFQNTRQAMKEIDYAESKYGIRFDYGAQNDNYIKKTSNSSLFNEKQISIENRYESNECLETTKNTKQSDSEQKFTPEIKSTPSDINSYEIPSKKLVNMFWELNRELIKNKNYKNILFRRN
ncbi:homeobox domain-containing protein [Hamiltosporidium tvaerminnensis]|uniref:Homeobox domain-containing protein n=2 Tax=Hamiltosporidium TaxID=1176354 RepID=A0A4Q9LZQ3_9MICR|nr:hypothetical protein LUQ84_001425 [Hamiltosporidium tvaerminnensis]TBU02297.1 homeobox domain-containing protein [Hamiltosporidium tvaerminnensis]TBU09023.1 homeobox domain-containing protein [Hamiltosporidium magnivora]TBU13290.1 homeobox domain-containing protein [Hamiltosporidium tvaerminnensis]